MSREPSDAEWANSDQLIRIADALEKLVTQQEPDNTDMIVASVSSGLHAQYADALSTILDNEEMDTFNKYVQLRDLQSKAQDVSIRAHEDYERFRSAND